MYSFITSGNFVIFKHKDDVSFVYTEEQASLYEKEVFKLHNTSKCIDWGLTEDTTRITFTIDEERYENVLLSSIEFDDVVCATQQDFIDGVQGMFENLAGGGSSGGSSYLVYDSFGDFPETGDNEKIYGALDTNLIYLWDSANGIYLLATFKLEPYQNGAMSNPVMAYVYRDESGNIYRVYEPIRNNDVMRGEESYNSTINTFPFDNAGFINCNPFIGGVTDMGSGCTANGVQNYGGFLNFNSKTNCSAIGGSIGRNSQIIFGKNSGSAIECVLFPTAILWVGDLAEAVTLNSGANLKGDANQFFVFLNNVTVGNNSVIKPGTTDLLGLSHSSIGNHCTVNLGGDSEALTIADGVSLSIGGNKTNSQYFNVAGTVYLLGESGGNATLTSV